MTELEIEQRRKAAKKWMDQGHSPAEAARKFGVTRTSTTRWKKEKCLDRRYHTGRSQRVLRQKIWNLLDTRKKWTGLELMAAIRDNFGVEYHSDYAGTLLRKYRQSRDEDYGDEQRMGL